METATVEKLQREGLLNIYIYIYVNYDKWRGGRRPGKKTETFKKMRKKKANSLKNSQGSMVMWGQENLHFYFATCVI